MENSQKNLSFSTEATVAMCGKKIVSDKIPCALQSRGFNMYFDLAQWRVYFSLLCPQHSVCGISSTPALINYPHLNSLPSIPPHIALFTLY